MPRAAIGVAAAILIGIPLATSARSHSSPGTVLPPPAVDIVSAVSATRTAVFAGGCFWGVEAVFEHLKGVIDVVSGYAGGSAETAHYETVGMGTSGHAESVEVTFDPAQITYGQLLQIFFSVAHDPTQLNRQGPDVGPQYRSAIFYADADQERVAKAYIAQISREKLYPDPIVTEVVRLTKFYPAEEYHQDYMARNPNELYIVMHDRPKVERLRKDFPALWRDAKK